MHQPMQGARNISEEFEANKDRKYHVFSRTKSGKYSQLIKEGIMQTYDEYVSFWNAKTLKQVEKELTSWIAYVQKHSKAYSWHGKDITPPGHLADGDKISALKAVIAEKQGQGQIATAKK